MSKKPLYTYAILTMLCFTTMLQGMAQHTLSENYRMHLSMDGLGENGMRSFILSVDERNNNTWKMTSRARINTGRNIALAQIRTDTMYSSRKMEDVLKDSLARNMFEMAVHTFMDHIDGIIRTDGITANEQITYDSGSGYFTVTVKAGKEDTDAVIRMFSADNTQLMVYYKKLKPFAGNYIDLGSKILKNGDYIILVKTPAQEFSGKVTKY